MCPNTPELMQEGGLCSSWALGFSICQPGLVVFSRKLPWPPKHSKTGASSTFQITHSVGCRSICYKSSFPGKGRKHNFHKTLSNWRKSSRSFLWKCCTPPGALCDLSCLESKWNGVSRRDSNGYFSKKEKLNFTMGILPLPWPFQQLTGTKGEGTSSEDWFIMQIFRVSFSFLTAISSILKKNPTNKQTNKQKTPAKLK